MITELGPDQLDRLRDLRVALHRHHVALDAPAGFVPRGEDDAWRRWLTSTAPLVHDGRAAVFASGDPSAPDGYALVRLRSREEVGRAVLVAADEHAELVTLVTAEDARGAGVGSALMDAAARWARERGATTLHIEVRAANDGALRFYRRHGAREAFTTMLLPLEPDPS